MDTEVVAAETAALCCVKWKLHTRAAQGPQPVVSLDMGGNIDMILELKLKNVIIN